MKANPFYILWGIISLLLIGGAGVFMFTSKSAYDDTKGSFDASERTIERLQKKAPYPNAKSVEDMEALVAAYETGVDELRDSLASFQRPLRADLRDSDFQKHLLDKLTAFKAAAAAAGMEVKGVSDSQPFYMGMDRYQETLPAPGNVPLLDYQLEAIDRLLAIMVESGVDGLLSLRREPLPTETDPTKPDPTSGDSVVRYELRVQFESDHDAFQKFINALANDKQFFYLLRVIRVDNSAPNGPKSDGPVEMGDQITFVNDNEEEPPPDLLTQANAIEDINERVEFMATHGYFPKSQDAKVLLGDETVEVFAVVDVARFPTESERNATGDDAAEGGDNN